jgi:hypothetical protein
MPNLELSRHAISRANALREHAHKLAGDQPALLQLLLLVLFLHMGASAYDRNHRISLLIRAAVWVFWTYTLWLFDGDSAARKRLSKHWMSFLHWMWPSAFRRAPAGFAITAAQDAIWDLHMSVRLAHARLIGADPPFEALQLVKERVSQTEKMH